MKKWGWDASWFGVQEGNTLELDQAIKAFQKENGLKVDGLVGEITFRRIYTERESMGDNSHYVRITGSKFEPVDFEVDHTYDNSDFKGAYRAFSGVRKPIEIVTHWDATLSAKHCISILQRRKISTHFIIDNDGKIFQLIDCNDIAWHASGHNNHTIGIDLSNAYYTKYQNWYVKNVGKPRPILTSKLHGRNLGKHLGFYNEQLVSYEKLLKFLTNYYNIPKTTPEVKGVHKPAVDKTYKGVVSHYHLTTNKIDCAGLDIDSILKGI